MSSEGKIIKAWKKNYKLLAKKELIFLRGKLKMFQEKEGKDECDRPSAEGEEGQLVPSDVFLAVNDTLTRIRNVDRKSLKFGIQEFSNGFIQLLQKLGLSQERHGKQIKYLTKSTILPKLKSFAWELCNGLTYTNHDYERFGFRDSSKCTYCTSESQTWTHLYMECKTILEFRKEWEALLGTSISEVEWIMGTDNKKTNTVIILLNKYIHSNNFAGTPLNKVELGRKMIACERTERSIAERNNRVAMHFKKWGMEYIKTLKILCDSVREDSQ